MENAVREGIKTTEFLFAALVVVCATVLLVTDDITEDTWKWAITTVGGAYILGRSFVKGTANNAEGKVASFKSDLAIMATAQAQEPSSNVNVAVVTPGAEAEPKQGPPPAHAPGRTIPPGS